MSKPLHDWDLSPKDAAQVQRDLAPRVLLRDHVGPIRRVLGIDVGYQRFAKKAHAAAVVLNWPDLATVEQAVVTTPLTFPYVPGLLSFREIPAALAVLDRITSPFDVVFCDGHGIAHPRGLGLACHLGLWLDKPAIGVAKSRLCGSHAEPDRAKGARVPLTVNDKQVGWVLRSRDGIKPLYVSPGHRIGLDQSAALALAACTRYRLPEPTRLADKLTKQKG